jgi:acyl carrier protein
MNEFCTNLAEALDVAEVKATDTLSGFPEWDSLSALSVIAMIDAKYGANLTAADLKAARTVADLWALAHSCQKTCAHG